MTYEQFCYWLLGFIATNKKDNFGLNSSDLEFVCNILQSVMKKNDSDFSKVESNFKNVSVVKNKENVKKEAHFGTIYGSRKK